MAGTFRKSLALRVSLRIGSLYVCGGAEGHGVAAGFAAFAIWSLLDEADGSLLPKAL